MRERRKIGFEHLCSSFQSNGYGCVGPSPMQTGDTPPSAYGVLFTSRFRVFTFVQGQFYKRFYVVALSWSCRKKEKRVCLRYLPVYVTTYKTRTMYLNIISNVLQSSSCLFWFSFFFHSPLHLMAFSSLFNFLLFRFIF